MKKEETKAVLTEDEKTEAAINNVVHAIVKQSAKMIGRAICADSYKEVEYSKLNQAKKLELLESAMRNGKPVNFSEPVKVELPGLYGINFLEALQILFKTRSIAEIVSLYHAEFKPTKEGEISDAYKVTSLWFEMDGKQILPVPEPAKKAEAEAAKKEA